MDSRYFCLLSSIEVYSSTSPLASRSMVRRWGFFGFTNGSRERISNSSGAIIPPSRPVSIYPLENIERQKQLLLENILRQK